MKFKILDIFSSEIYQSEITNYDSEIISKWTNLKAFVNLFKNSLIQKGYTWTGWLPWGRRDFDNEYLHHGKDISACQTKPSHSSSSTCWHSVFLIILIWHPPPVPPTGTSFVQLLILTLCIVINGETNLHNQSTYT